MALRQVPGLESVFRIVGDWGLKKADETGLVTEINQSVTDQGITLRITEAMYDGTRLTFGYLQEAPDGIEELDDVEYQINGKSMHFAGSSSGNRIDQNTYAGVVNLTPDVELPEKFQLSIHVYRIGSIDGQWQYTIPISRMTTNNKVVLPMTVRSSGDVTLTVQKITFTPSLTELSIQIKQPKQNQKFINFDLIDDKGIVLDNRGGSGSGETEGDYEIMNFKQMFSPVQAIPKSLTLRPTINEPATHIPKEIKVAMEHTPDEQHPLILSQGESGFLQITQVEYLKDRTLVHYQAKGTQPYLQGSQLWIEGESGEKYRIMDKSTETLDPAQYKFIREFPSFKPDQKLIFVTRELPGPNYTKELEMTIPVTP
jgi:hypothetical protein